jgi:hypothetical protein
LSAAIGGISNAAGQFTSNKGIINLTEVGLTSYLSTIPGGIQNKLINDAIYSGLGQNTINALGSLALVGQAKVAGEAVGQGLSAALPSYNIDASNWYNSYQNILDAGKSSISSFLTNNSWSSNAANGGFVIYPNKSNNNMIQSIYAK